MNDHARSHECLSCDRLWDEHTDAERGEAQSRPVANPDQDDEVERLRKVLWPPAESRPVANPDQFDARRMTHAWAILEAEVKVVDGKPVPNPNRWEPDRYNAAAFVTALLAKYEELAEARQALAESHPVANPDALRYAIDFAVSHSMPDHDDGNVRVEAGAWNQLIREARQALGLTNEGSDE